MAPDAAWILSARRTPIGKFLGSLSTLSATDLGVVAAVAALHDADVESEQIDEAIVGNVLSAGLGQAPARQVALRAGMSPASSALTVNMVCGSGLRAVMLAARSAQSGESNLVLAGGIESMSQAPHLLRGGRNGWKFGEQPMVDSILHDGLTCAIEGWPMGMAAESTATTCGLTRQDLDAFALRSHRLAIQAQVDGAFRSEIVGVSLQSNKTPKMVETDEGPRSDTNLDSLARLRPSFREDGIVTAGNASTLSDGAAMLVIGSESAIGRTKAAPLARIVSMATSGGEPRDLFLTPIPAVRLAVSRAGLSLDQIDLFEINEAFAAQMLGCIEGLGLEPDRVNVRGGSIALGHPIGASGARILVTLVHALRARRGRYGVAALCLGGGNAVALVIERA